MKKTIKNIMVIVLLAGFALLALGSCGSFLGSSYSGSSSGGGSSSSSSVRCPNGSCHVFTDSDGDGSYNVCSRSSCSANKVPYPVPAGTNVYCSCY